MAPTLVPTLVPATQADEMVAMPNTGVYDDAAKAVCALALRLDPTDPLYEGCRGLASALRLRAARDEMRAAFARPLVSVQAGAGTTLTDDDQDGGA